MSAPKGIAPIIIKKKKKGGGHGHHGGAWKVAYADFVTAMMAFFLVMWVVGLSESKRKDISGYFREPGVFSFTTGKALPVDPHGEQLERQLSPSDQGSRSDMGDRPQRKTCAGGRTVADTNKLKQAASEIQGQLDKLAKSDADWKLVMGSVSVEITNEGLRIEMSESKDLAFFDVGGAQPRKVARDLLTALAPKLAQLGNQLAIEGHTDMRAYSKGAGYGNWELSADRANAARKILLDNGIPEAQLGGVTGYASRKLRKPQSPYDVANRRVSIIVRYPEGSPVDVPDLSGAPFGPPTPFH